MKNPYIKWTKTYLVKHDLGNFTIYISSHKEGYIAGMVMYYIVKRKGPEASVTIPRMEIKHENVFGKSEEEVYNSCVEWISKNLKGRFKITLKKTA